MFEKEAKKRARDFTDNEGRQVAYECGFLDGADRMKEEMQKLKEDNADFKQSLDWANERKKENTERIVALEEANTVLERRIERAKRCMKKLMFIINSDPANYNCKGLMQDAEDFIHNRICNIRQLGEHCISETRCIMCDMEDKNEKGNRAEN